MCVHNKYTGYTLKHLLLRHLYNLPLPVLRCYALEPHAATAAQIITLCTVLCGALYTACVDASRMVFWDRSVLR